MVNPHGWIDIWIGIRIDSGRTGMKARYLIPVAVFLVMVVVLYVGLGRDPRHVPSPLIGKPAPAFDLPLLYSMDERMTQEALKGQVSLVNVWASWCVSCRLEHDLLLQISRNTNIAVIGFNYKDEEADALKYLRKYGDPYAAIVYDHEGRAAIDWGVYGTPETFVVDRQGIIRHKHTGPIDEKKLREELMPIIRKLQES